MEEEVLLVQKGELLFLIQGLLKFLQMAADMAAVEVGAGILFLAAPEDRVVVGSVGMTPSLVEVLF